ncbi:hypothetical protein [uncultured Algibacter sp.]|uniref:hypothetical protein n=1 Tax=uncultured Algibacter sp. TaxID=298659 RepID=UPI00321648F3
MNFLSLLFSTLLFLTSCSSDDNKKNQEMQVETNGTLEASIVSVSSAGDTENYTFNIGISSPDTGCNQYANWWEVITEDGALIYRRILGHSHVNEQPFIRSGGTIPITANQIVIVRAHMNTSGYGTKIFKGSVSSGFTQDTLAKDFAINLEGLDPQPVGCAF